MNALSRLDLLTQAQPEWSPWLRVVRELLPELSRPSWDAEAPGVAPSSSTLSPQLAGATLRPDGRAVAQLLDRLTSTARAQGLQALAGTEHQGPKATVEDALGVFLAAVNSDEDALQWRATRTGATAEGVRALAELLAMPYLHGCARRWAAASPRADWSQGYCPVCGAWPTLAEVRGVERARHLRCGRCGAGWPMPVLACTYCGTTDHDTLGTLVVDEPGERFTVDVCRTCSGYLKSCTTLQATPSNELLVTDLSSVAFDLAAVERGFRRPPGPGVALRAAIETVEAAPAASAHRWWWS